MSGSIVGLPGEEANGRLNAWFSDMDLMELIRDHYGDNPSQLAVHIGLANFVQTNCTYVDIDESHCFIKMEAKPQMLWRLRFMALLVLSFVAIYGTLFLYASGRVGDGAWDILAIIAILVLPLAVVVPTSRLKELNAALDNMEDKLLDLTLAPLAADGVSIGKIGKDRHWLLWPHESRSLFIVHLLIAGGILTVLVGNLGWLYILGPVFMLPVSVLAALFIVNDITYSFAGSLALKKRNLQEFWRNEAGASIGGSASLFLFPVVLSVLVTVASYFTVLGYDLSQMAFTPSKKELLGILGDKSLEFLAIPASARMTITYETRTVGFLVLISGLFAIVLVLSSMSYIDRERKLWREVWSNPPHLSPSGANEPRMAVVTFGLLLRWFLVASVNLFGTITIVLIWLWLCGIGTPSPLISTFESVSGALAFWGGAEGGKTGIGLTSPLDWFNDWMVALYGEGVGLMITRFVWVGVTLPALAWISLTMLAAMRRIGLLGLLAVSDSSLSRRRKEAPEIEESISLSGLWPSTEVLLPFPHFAIVTIPHRFTNLVSEQELAMAIAHEIGHAAVHGRRLWLTEWAGLLSLTGRGYSSLLFDYWRMELEADAYAVAKEGDLPSLVGLLGRLDVIEAQAAWSSDSVSETASDVSGDERRPWIVKWFRGTYDFYFSSPLWGRRHPPSDYRINELMRRFAQSSRQEIH